MSQQFTESLVESENFKESKRILRYDKDLLSKTRYSKLHLTSSELLDFSRES